MKKITLINLPTPFLDEAMNPPLGLCYIGAVLRANGYKVNAIDFAVYDYDYTQYDYLRKINLDADFYGIYCSSAQFKWLKEVSFYLKRNNKKAVIVVGGPHASAEPEECLRKTDCDIAVNGEGELAMLEIVKGEKLRYINGACYLNSNEFVHKNRVFISNLDSMPEPDFSLFDMEKYKRKMHDERAIHIITLRGCPYDCHFCNSSLVGREIRYISVKKVFEHIDNVIADYGIRNFYIYDDIFTFKRDRLKEFCKGFAARGISWRCWTRADLLREEDLILMKESGLESIAMGIESGDDQILKNINKHSTVEKNRRAILLCKKLGVPVRCSLMFGNPGESLETLNNTVELIRETQPDEWNLSLLVPAPGSEFWNNPEKHGLPFNKQEVIENNYQDIVRSGNSGLGNLVVRSFGDETISVLKYFIGRLEYVCPRKKIRDVVQRLEIEKV